MCYECNTQPPSPIKSHMQCCYSEKRRTQKISIRVSRYKRRKGKLTRFCNVAPLAVGFLSERRTLGPRQQPFPNIFNKKRLLHIPAINFQVLLFSFSNSLYECVQFVRPFQFAFLCGMSKICNSFCSVDMNSLFFCQFMGLISFYLFFWPQGFQYSLFSSPLFVDMYYLIYSSSLLIWLN